MDSPECCLLWLLPGGCHVCTASISLLLEMGFCCTSLLASVYSILKSQSMRLPLTPLQLLTESISSPSPPGSCWAYLLPSIPLPWQLWFHLQHLHHGWPISFPPFPGSCKPISSSTWQLWTYLLPDLVMKVSLGERSLLTRTPFPSSPWQLLSLSPPLFGSCKPISSLIWWWRPP